MALGPQPVGQVPAEQFFHLPDVLREEFQEFTSWADVQGSRISTSVQFDRGKVQAFRGGTDVIEDLRELCPWICPEVLELEE